MKPSSDNWKDIAERIKQLPDNEQDAEALEQASIDALNSEDK